MINEEDLIKAKELLDQKNKQDVDLCIKEFNEAIKPILEKYGCTLVVSGEFYGDKCKPVLRIVKSN